MNVPEEFIYPIGKMPILFNYTADHIQNGIQRIANLPEKLTALTHALSDDELALTYRPNGWNIRQIVHHIADSHINSYLRCKFAMELENPTIMPYDENVWACFRDGAELPVDSTLKLLEGLHFRWVTFLKSLDAKDLERTYFHPANQKKTKIGETILMYAWHSDHHFAQIKGILERRTPA